MRLRTIIVNKEPGSWIIGGSGKRDFPHHGRFTPAKIRFFAFLENIYYNVSNRGGCTLFNLKREINIHQTVDYSI